MSDEGVYTEWELETLASFTARLDAIKDEFLSRLPEDEDGLPDSMRVACEDE